MSSLVTFSINTGRLEHLPASIAIDHRKLAGISIFGNRLKDLPKTLGELNYLQMLAVTGNKLTSLPESIGALGYLQRVEVGHNQLASLPLQIGQLKNLKFLDAQRNQLTSLPESIGQLKNLEHLFVENNRLTSLPESIGSLEKLVDFHAWSNNITALPDAVGNMKSLESVDLRHNGIDELPGTIYNWHSILYFYITGNKVCENLKLEAGTFDYVEDSFCEKQCAVDCPSFLQGDFYLMMMDCMRGEHMIYYGPRGAMILRQNQILDAIQNHVITTMAIVSIEIFFERENEMKLPLYIVSMND